MLFIIAALLLQHHWLSTDYFDYRMKQIEKTKVITAEITYYTAFDEGCTGITASGTQATEGRTIAMSEEFPFGTKVIIDNHVYVIEDRGGAIVGNKVDVFVNDVETALNRGRQRKNIRIVEE